MPSAEEIYNRAQRKWEEGWGKADDAKQKSEGTVQEWQEWAMEEHSKYNDSDDRQA